jgi:hypothetical protein
LYSTYYLLMESFIVRYNGKFIKIHPRPYEPERMTTDIAWLQIKEGLTPEQAYKKWFELQRKISRLLLQ